jgi:hypothetical protein
MLLSLPSGGRLKQFVVFSNHSFPDLKKRRISSYWLSIFQSKEYVVRELLGSLDTRLD